MKKEVVAVIYKMASWNVNGLRSCMGKGFMNFLEAGDFDLLGLQEIKMLKEQADFSFAGYHDFWNSAEKKGYSGTLVLSKHEPLSVKTGMDIAEHDREGRIVALEFEKFWFVNVYTPNAQRELVRLEYRLSWERDFSAWLSALGKPVVLCGDLNVAHKEIDLKNPKSNTKNAGFSPQERQAMTDLLATGYVDTFRELYPDTRDAYSWWSYMGGARARNAGWRIDYFVVSEVLRGGIKEAIIYPDVHGSDHCPVGLVLGV